MTVQDTQPMRHQVRRAVIPMLVTLSAVLLFPNLASAHEGTLVNYDGPTVDTYEEDCPDTIRLHEELGDYLWELRWDGLLTEDQANELSQLLDTAVYTQAQWAIMQLGERLDSIGLPQVYEQYVLDYVDGLDTVIPCVPITGLVNVVNPGSPVFVVETPKITISLAGFGR